MSPSGRDRRERFCFAMEFSRLAIWLAHPCLCGVGGFFVLVTIVIISTFTKYTENSEIRPVIP